MTCELPVFSGQEVGQKSHSALRRANFYSHVVRRVKEKRMEEVGVSCPGENSLRSSFQVIDS